LPGPTFVRSFLRTYAQALGLDAKALVEEYRLSYESPSEAALEPIVSTPRGTPRPRMPSAGPSRGYLALVGGVSVVIVLLIVGLISNSGGGSSPKTTGAAARGHAKHGGAAGAARGGGRRPRASTGTTGLVSLRLEPTGEVYVCLIGDNASKRIPGVILKPGARAPTYHARRFLLTLGNNAVTMTVDGTPQTVPASSQAIGYAITRAGTQPLKPGELPTCA
jgi:cytoskeleton protein RodZ